MARRDSSTGNDDSSMSILDVFANGMGCVLMLMVVFVLRITVSSGGSGQESRPAMITIAWSAENPPKGAGPSQLKVKVVREGYADNTAGEVPEGWTPPALASGATYESETGVAKYKSLILLVPELGKKSRWLIKLGLEYERPLILSTRQSHPFEVLVDQIDQRWNVLEDISLRDVARKEIFQLVDDHQRFLEIISEYQAKWLSQETGWKSSPEDASFKAIMHARWLWAATCYDELKGLTYPIGGTKIDTSWYTRHVIDGVLQTAEFEQELTRLIHSELEYASLSGAPVDLTTSRQALWSKGVKSLLDDRFRLPLRVTFVGGVGDPIVDQSAVFENPFNHSNGGWTSLSTLEVDSRNSIEWEWEDIQPESKADSSVSTLDAHKPIELSLWDQAVATLPVHDDLNSLQRIDNALALLASLQQKSGNSKGSFKKASEHDTHHGPAITSLALMAFLSRGHTPDATHSNYRSITIDAVEYLVSMSQREGGKLGENGSGHFAYHHGFATMALAQAIPHLKATSTQTPTASEERDVVNRVKKLLPAAEKALDRAVELLVGVQPYGRGTTGGWGYDDNFDDTSVAAVQVKALVEAYYYVSSERKQIVKETLQGAKSFFESSRSKYGTYRYRSSKAVKNVAPPSGELRLSSSNPVWPARLPGCLLAECYCNPNYFSLTSVKSSWAPGISRFKLWTPTKDDLTRDSYAHYALYYASHIRNELRSQVFEDDENREWFKATTDAIMFAQERDGRFAEGTYGTAMAIISLSLPIQSSIVDRFVN